MIERIISGGQTGADRGALDAALERNFPCGGWCPAGRRAEDGVIPDRYPMIETPTANYIDRTRRNVEMADATVVVTRGAPSGGTRATVRHAKRVSKPCLVIDLDATRHAEALDILCGWLDRLAPATLNVAGPRASGCDGIDYDTAALIGAVLDRQGAIAES